MDCVYRPMERFHLRDSRAIVVMSAWSWPEAEVFWVMRCASS